ncbi:MAG: hypothetical protein OXF98_05365 [Rhodospirillaceae bacterium]|nr:hypothetical protein [Rhodospirillaceae bacterium]
MNVTPKGAGANDASVTMMATLIAVRLSRQAVMAIFHAGSSLGESP